MLRRFALVGVSCSGVYLVNFSMSSLYLYSLGLTIMFLFPFFRMLSISDVHLDYFRGVFLMERRTSEFESHGNSQLGVPPAARHLYLISTVPLPIHAGLFFLRKNYSNIWLFYTFAPSIGCSSHLFHQLVVFLLFLTAIVTKQQSTLQR